MKLYEIINTLQQIASAQPAVNNVFEGSVYQLNELKDIKYASVVITQGQHTQDRDFITYNFNIFYVDRLTADASNKLPVQSTALDVLANIILAMDELDFEFSNIYYNTFTERFEAECAGAYATVSFQAPAELCADWYDIIVSNIRAEGNGYSILEEYAKKTWVLEQISAITVGSGITLEEAQELIDEAMEAETARTESTYLKEHQSLSGYATENWVREQGYITSADTQNFLTSSDTQNFLTSADTQDFITSAYTDNAIAEAMAQETARTENTYLKEHQSLSGYATEEWVQEQGYITGCTGINDSGNEYIPVYVSGGTVIPCKISTLQERWGVNMIVKPDDGGVEGGAYYDFHNADTLSDYSGRIQKKALTDGFTFMYDTGFTGYTNVLMVNERFAVDSPHIIHIMRISQSDYDDLVLNDQVNAFTLYLIPEE